MVEAPGALTAVTTVTAESYGTPTVAVSVITEAAVEFATTPTATGGDKSVQTKGALNAVGYAYCGIKAGRMLEGEDDMEGWTI